MASPLVQSPKTPVKPRNALLEDLVIYSAPESLILIDQVLVWDIKMSSIHHFPIHICSRAMISGCSLWPNSSGATLTQMMLTTSPLEWEQFLEENQEMDLFQQGPHHNNLALIGLPGLHKDSPIPRTHILHWGSAGTHHTVNLPIDHNHIGAHWTLTVGSWNWNATDSNLNLQYLERKLLVTNIWGS